MSNVSYEANIWTMVRTPDFPSRLFKFMKAEHAALMCQSNRVRYGTIYDFRKQENHGNRPVWGAWPVDLAVPMMS